MKMKLPSPEGGVITIKSNQKTTRKSYESSLKNRRRTYVITVQAEEPGWIAEAEVINERWSGPTGEVQEREIKGKKFKLDTSLGKELEDKIVDVISKNMGVFALSSANMPEIDPDFYVISLPWIKGSSPSSREGERSMRISTSSSKKRLGSCWLLAT